MSGPRAFQASAQAVPLGPQSLTPPSPTHTPGTPVPVPPFLLKPLSGGLHWSGCLAAGRRCGALEAAPHGRCQPERWAGSGSVVGQGRQQGALIGGGRMGGSPGRAQGRQRGGLRLERGGGACPGSCVGWCVSGRVGEERRGRLGQPSSIGGR